MNLRNITDVEKLLPGKPTARELHEIWNRRRPIADSAARKGSRNSTEDLTKIAWVDELPLVRTFISQALRCEEYLLVLDAAREVLQVWPNLDENDRTLLIHVRMDYATALTRLGFLDEARAELEPCIAPGFQPELGRGLRTDILLQLGDVLREESYYAADRPTRIQAAQAALNFCNLALQADPGRLDAMVRLASAAFRLAHLGEDLRQVSQETARRILAVTRELTDTEGPRRRFTWAEANAHAVLGEIDEAARSFEQLQHMPEITTAELATARFEAQFLAEALGKSRNFFKSAFPPLQLIVFAGHLPDLPTSPVRFPPESVSAVRDSLREKLRSMGARVGLASACAGSDLLFGEVLRELGGTLHLVLPWSRDEFRQTSVLPYERPGGAPLWLPLFEKALEEAATTREIGHIYQPGGDGGWALEVTAGVALHTARALRLDIQPLVLWDGLPGADTGGTDAFHSFWSHKLQVEPIVLPPPVSPEFVRGVGGFVRQGCERSIQQQVVKSMLFADVQGYSKLTEQTTPEFIGVFLDRLGKLVAGSKFGPCSVETWGDALYAVFDCGRDAGMFALEVIRMMEDGKPDWLAKGLYWESRSETGEIVKNPIRFRIGLHTGPVVMHFNPVVRRIGFTGAHVSRAARIEPVTRPGEIYTSEEFAAMVELSGELRRLSGASSEQGFVCEYAGSMQLAKDYPGRHRIYRVVPKRSFAIEALARVVHEDYCDVQRALGETPAGNTSLRPWEELSEDLKDANRAQVADIPNKLRMLGLELAAGEGMSALDISLTPDRVEEMAIREHDRWMEERRKNGWTYAPIRDNARKYHPCLIPWDHLSEPEKDKDRRPVRNLPRLIDRAGFRVRPL